MQIKINLDSLFGSNSPSETIPESTKSQSQSMCSSISANTRTYQFNHQLFDDQDGDWERSKRQPKLKPPYSKANSIVTMKTQFSERVPGQRLYYESMNNTAKKILEIERIKSEKVEEQNRQATFKPAINQNSKKIVNQKGKQNIIGKKKVEKGVPTQILKQRQQLIECTHKPQLNSKFPSQNNRLSDRFQELYNDYKLKEVRMKIKTEESLPYKGDKKLTKSEFQGFLNRNNEFMNKVQKKNELILATSTKFDLQTGHKMFSPKTNTFKPHKNYFASKTEEKVSDPSTRYNTSQQIKPKPLFSKNYDSYQEPSPFQMGSNQKGIRKQNQEFGRTSFHKIKQQVEEEEIIQEFHIQGFENFDVEEFEDTAPGFKVCSKQAEKPLQESECQQKSNQNSLAGSKCGKSLERSYSFDKQYQQNQSPVRDELQNQVNGSKVKEID